MCAQPCTDKANVYLLCCSFNSSARQGANALTPMAASSARHTARTVAAAGHAHARSFSALSGLRQVGARFRGPQQRGPFANLWALAGPSTAVLAVALCEADGQGEGSAKAETKEPGAAPASTSSDMGIALPKEAEQFVSKRAHTQTFLCTLPCTVYIMHCSNVLTCMHNLQT